MQLQLDHMKHDESLKTWTCNATRMRKMIASKLHAVYCVGMHCKKREREKGKKENYGNLNPKTEVKGEETCMRGVGPTKVQQKKDEVGWHSYLLGEEEEKDRELGRGYRRNYEISDYCTFRR